jgi:hypothetical protein
MKLSLELPKAHLKDLSPLCDLDFCLAQHVLEDAEYADFYKEQRKLKRTVILDNGYHELGSALSPLELLEATKRIEPTVVIAPDKLADAKFNYESFKAMARMHLPEKTGLGTVLAGGDFSERSMFIENVKSSSMICLPFRAPRWIWYREHTDALLWNWRWIHLLGVNEFQELRNFAGELGAVFSVDTAKPIKWGADSVRMDTLTSPRGHRTRNAQVFDLDLFETKSQIETTLWNIAYLRTHLVR